MTKKHLFIVSNLIFISSLNDQKNVNTLKIFEEISIDKSP